MNDKYLISQELIKGHERITGQKYDYRRRTGRSTIVALSTITKSMIYPEEPQKIYDHHGTADAHKHLAFMIERIIGQLHLKGFEIDFRKLTLTFYLFEPSPSSSRKKRR